MNANPCRRWFRIAFSLRTMFVLVTVFGVWLGWQTRIVRARREAINWLNAEPESGEVIENDSDIAEFFARAGDGCRADRRKSSFSIPWYRALLGDKAMLYIQGPLERRQELLALFPEASIAPDFYPQPPPTEQETVWINRDKK